MMKIIVYFKEPIRSWYDESSQRQCHDKIRAIKAVRAITRSGLRDSKECTEAKVKIETEIGEDTYSIPEFSSHIAHIRSVGGAVIFDSSQWDGYIDEINEMLFRAKMSGHDMVIYHLESIAKEHAEYEKLKNIK